MKLAILSALFVNMCAVVASAVASVTVSISPSAGNSYTISTVSAGVYSVDCYVGNNASDAVITVASTGNNIDAIYELKVHSLIQAAIADVTVGTSSNRFKSVDYVLYYFDSPSHARALRLGDFWTVGDV